MERVALNDHVARMEDHLAGLDQHELITIPALPDIADWEKYEAARKALGPNLSRQKPAARYGIQS